MTTAERGSLARPRRSRLQVCGHAFGIEVEASFPVPELPPAGADRGVPRTRLELADSAALKRAWPAREAATLLERTFSDGSPMLVVEGHGHEGFLVWAPRYGRYVVSADGGRVRCSLPRMSAWRWERLLFAQVLPLASVLHGRELLHASAVALNGGAIGVSGPSGAGKSSITAHLVARGAAFVTDDVLAVARSGDRVLAYPGPSLQGVDARQLAALSDEERSRLGLRLGESDKIYLAVPVVDGPRPLRALYFLSRRSGGDVEIGPTESPSVQLLGNSFISYLRSPERLVRHLDVCSRIAETIPMLEVSVPASMPAAEVAAAVELHAGAMSEESA